MGAKKPSLEPELPYTAKSGSFGMIQLGLPVFCLNCGRRLTAPRKGQKFCRKTKRQNGSCKDKYHNRGLRRLSRLENRVGILEARVLAMELFPESK